MITKKEEQFIKKEFGTNDLDKALSMACGLIVASHVYKIIKEAKSDYKKNLKGSRLK